MYPWRSSAAAPASSRSIRSPASSEREAAMRMTADWQRLIPVALAVFLMGAGGGGSALVDAARNGDKAALRALLQKKVDVNATEADGATALHWASYRDDVESADLLLRAGANVNAANDLGATPLWAASQNGSAAMVGT